MTLRLGDRRAALAVGGVLGACELAPGILDTWPALLGAAAADIVEQVGVLDAQLLLVLRVSRLVPETLWETLAAPGGLR